MSRRLLILCALVGSLCVAVPLVGPSAGAAPVALPVSIGGGGGSGEAGWQIAGDGGTTSATPAGGAANGSPGFVVRNAFTPLSLGSAFDAGLTLWVNGVVYAPAGADLVAASDLDTITGSAVTMSGLGVTVQHQADQTANVLRTLASFTNPGAGAVTVTVELASNLGVPPGPFVASTSSGDTSFTTADRWVATNGVSGSGPSRKAAVLSVLAGPGPVEAPLVGTGTAVFDASGTEGILARYQVTVPAGATRRLLWFHELWDSTIAAVAGGQCYEARSRLASCGTLPGFLDAGRRVGDLGPTVEAEILNWDLAADGYWLVASDGGVFGFGGARFWGSMGGTRLNKPINGMAPSIDGNGYWLVASDGGIFAFGTARFLGSLGALPLNQPIAAMAATADGNGYWLVARDGGVFAFGTAGFYGSLGGAPGPYPIVAIVPTPSGHGYWLAASDETVTAFGDAGALPAASLPTPAIVAAIGSGTDGGLRLVDATGGTRVLGDAAPVLGLQPPGGVVSGAGTPTRAGQWTSTRAGRVDANGDAGLFGDLSSVPLNAPIVALAAHG
jgi:hypothetical protein